jgi:Na+-transporting methylmalonyl-CoA/oxaloacetate decarboxylase beta subunit
MVSDLSKNLLVKILRGPIFFEILETKKNGKVHIATSRFLKTVKKSENVNFPTLTAILITI